MTMSEYGDRLRLALDASRITQAELARKIDVKQQTISYLCARAAGSKHSAAIARILGVSLTWLTEGRGEMYGGNDDRTPTTGHNITPPGPSYHLAPIVSFANAGCWAEVVDSYEPGDSEHYYPIPPNIRCSAMAFWTEVTGRSMISVTGSASYPPGTLILIDPEDRDLVSGRLVIARLNDTHEATFKRLNIEGGQCFLEPLNTQYPVLEINSSAQVIGTVKGALIAEM